MKQQKGSDIFKQLVAYVIFTVLIGDWDSSSFNPCEILHRLCDYLQRITEILSTTGITIILENNS